MLSSPTLSVYPAVCRICHSSEASIPYNGAAPGEPLISPCSCKFVNICKFAFQIR
uniref:Uncharacterized protein n=1 Tax=Parascaris equorum TaxID=6256 RepID=A0A914RNS5_PAREQ